MKHPIHLYAELRHYTDRVTTPRKLDPVRSAISRSAQEAVREPTRRAFNRGFEDATGAAVESAIEERLPKRDRDWWSAMGPRRPKYARGSVALGASWWGPSYLRRPF